ncbi:MAG: SGNH/GDSL hydrolase family protein [Chloroflexi bacterium]|nr:MAG: SGNH/GDSL hydrolase family protein [Chloroflexota bacterium]
MTKTAVPTPTPVCNDDQQPFRYLALGDSYTIGESVMKAERWPVQLVNTLRSNGIAITDAEIIAKTGWTTDELMTGIANTKPTGPYDLVTLLIGVNNQYRGLSQEVYRDEFVGLLETAVTFANNNPSHVIVVSIPDWGATPFAHREDRDAIGAAIDAFNAINRTATEETGAHFIDITPISRKALTDATLTAEDFLHPSSEMYAEWVTMIVPIAEQILCK